MTVGLLPAVTQASLEDGLIAYYAFNPADAVGVDVTGNHPATLAGSPLPTKAPDIVRNPTAAAHFPIGGYADAPSFADVHLDSYSITTWFKMDELGPSQILVLRGPAGPSVSSVGLYTAGANLIGEHESDGMHGITVQIEGALTADQWYGAAFTYDEQTREMKLYLASCGIEIVTRDADPYAEQGNQNYPLVLGANGEHDGFLGGSLDEVRIYDRALSQAEARYLLTGCVPEPATIALLGLGGLSLLRRRRS